MGWPLILALASSAGEAESGSHADNVAREYREEVQAKEQSARNRLYDEQAKDERQEAMARMLKATPQPAAVGRPRIIPESTEVPDYLKNLEQLQGLSQLVGGLGQYWDQNPEAQPDLFDSLRRLKSSRLMNTSGAGDVSTGIMDGGYA